MKKEEMLVHRLGPTVREIAQKAGIKVLQFQGVLAEAMQENRGAWAEEGVAYTDDTVHGYLYKKAWPNMECAETVAIVTDALERAILPNRANEARIRRAQAQAAYKIEWAYSGYDSKARHDSYTQAGGAEIVRATLQHMEPTAAYTLAKNLDACFSLDSDDIAFWNIIRRWNTGKKEQALKTLSTYKGMFQAGALFHHLEAPEIAQWLAIRDKRYNETLSKAKPPKTAKEIAAQAEKRVNSLTLTDEMLDSFSMMIAAIQGDGTAKNPVYPTVDIDLLLMFKYCLTEKKQRDMLTQHQEKKQKREVEKDV